MAKRGKFIYNPETLNYEKVERSFQKRFFAFMGFLFSSLVLAAVLTMVGYTYFDLPKERILKRQISTLRKDYKELNEKVTLLDTVLRKFEQRDNNIFRIIFEAEPLGEEVRQGSALSDIKGKSFSTIFEKVEQKIDSLSYRVHKQSLSYDTLYNIALEREKFLASIPSIPPIDLRKLRSRMSGFGFRIHPIYKIRRPHTGVDMSARLGTPIYATGDGTVISVGLRGGYGKTVIIDHGFGYKTLYGHMDSYRVQKWRKVKRGQIIGTVGNTGLSTAPHVHYEVLKNGKAVNPINYFYADLTTDEYELILKQIEEANQSFD